MELLLYLQVRDILGTNAKKLLIFLLLIFLFESFLAINAKGDFIYPKEYAKILKKGIDVNWANTNKGIKYYNKKSCRRL